jgi:hypothetical protein
VVQGRAEDKTCLQTVPIGDAGGPGSLVTHRLYLHIRSYAIAAGFLLQMVRCRHAGGSLDVF